MKIMPAASYSPMATLQVKNLSDDRHAGLRARAEEEGTILSELVTRLLRRELAVLDAVRAHDNCCSCSMRAGLSICCSPAESGR